MKTEFKVGILILSAVATLLYMTSRLTKQGFSTGEAKVFYALFDNAIGLNVGSRVKVAGLNVGQVQSMDLHDNRARIGFSIDASINVNSDAAVMLRSVGFLGDKYIALNPGTSTVHLNGGEELKTDRGSQTLEELVDFSGKILADLQEVAAVVKESVKGTQEGNARLTIMLANMEKFSEQLAQVHGLGKTSDDIGKIADDMSYVTDKIRNGEGTIGKLVNDDKTADQITTTLSGVDNLMSQVSGIGAAINFDAAALGRDRNGRGDLYLDVGVASDKIIAIGTTIRPNDNQLSQGSEATFDAQYIQRLGKLFLKAGLFEGTGGVGATYEFINGNLNPFVEFYRFGATDPQLNIGARFNIAKPFYGWTGIDYITSSDLRTYFAGVGVMVPLIGAK